MGRTALVLLVSLLALPGATAAGDAPADFLAAARAAHRDLTVTGLRSFTARLVLRRSADENLSRMKERAGFGYSYRAPDQEAFDFAGTHPSLVKPLRDAVQNLWRDATGALWFDLLEKAAEPVLAREETRTVFTGQVEKLGEVRAGFESDSKKMVELALPKLGVTLLYVLEATPEGFRVSWREARIGGSRVLRTFYGVLRKVSGFELPTVLTLESDRNTTEFAIEYETVNGKPAVLLAPDPAEVKARVARFEKEWRGYGEARKIGEMRALAEIPADAVSAAIAAKGLRDPSPDVREQAAETLGIMRRANVVPALTAAMKKNEKEIRVYLRLIEALGAIGDPRAVDVLSKDWWNQRVGEYGIAAAKAKIRALGNIRHVSAVDALIDTFTLTKNETVSLVKDDLVASLRKLTDQDFGYDRRAWKRWWKKNRSRHLFD